MNPSQTGAPQPETANDPNETNCNPGNIDLETEVDKGDEASNDASERWGSCTQNLAEETRKIRAFQGIDDDHPIELVALTSDKRVFVCQCDTINDHIDALDSVEHAVPNYFGVFMPVNHRVNPQIFCRYKHGYWLKSTNRTSAQEVEQREDYYIDVDVKRVPGISATAKEKLAAQEVANKIIRDLVRIYKDNLGIEDPSLGHGDSGNGDYILGGMVPHAPTESADLLKRLLHCLARKYDSEKVRIDPSVFNPDRYAGTRHNEAQRR